MANPNIVSVSSIYGTTTLNAVTTAGVVVADNAGSATTNKLFKVNLLSISNVDGVNDANVSVEVLSGVNGGSGQTRHLVKTVTVPADSTLIVIDKNTSLYLMEDMQIKVIGSAAGDLEAICSYDVIDDA
tara:strand:+ start:57 stop:443 length:387 start_codon:yes stop_codon:yes gene_type:complete